MLIAAIITGLLAIYFALRARHCFKRSKIMDGNIEGLGILLYVPLAAFSGVITVVFAIIALIQRMF